MLTNWTINEIDNARKAVATLLDAMELDAYLFEVEPADEQWDIRLEWARGKVWTRVTLSAGHDKLLASLDDAGVHDTLLREWLLALGVG